MVERCFLCAHCALACRKVRGDHWSATTIYMMLRKVVWGRSGRSDADAMWHFGYLVLAACILLTLVAGCVSWTTTSYNGVICNFIRVLMHALVPVLMGLRCTRPFKWHFSLKREKNSHAMSVIEVAGLLLDATHLQASRNAGVVAVCRCIFLIFSLSLSLSLSSCSHCWQWLLLFVRKLIKFELRDGRMRAALMSYSGQRVRAVYSRHICHICKHS